MNPLAIARRMAFLRFPGTARLFAVSLLARSLPSGAKAKRSAARPLDRRGVTLIELMVALAITMIMMTAVITLFSNVTTTVSNSRALIEISERLRTARNRLQLDLAGHTATTIPPLRPEDGEGYLEIIEGPNSDAGSYVPNPNTPPYGVPSPINGTTVSYAVSASGSANEIMGDADDVLMLTVRSQAEPFVGWAAGGVLTESNTAEVIWYAVPNGRSLPGDSTAFNGAPVQLFTLYRRVLLVAPLVVPSGKPFTANNPGSISQFYNQYDLSVRSSNNGGAGTAVGNTLTDLTLRENRFLHAFQVPTTPTTNLPTISSLSGWPTNAANTMFNGSPSLTASSFPFAVQNPSYYITPGGASTPSYLTSSLVTIPAALFNNATVNSALPNNQRQGEDVILTDVLSFDIRVFDPFAAQVALSANSSTTLIPGDPGYYTTVNTAGSVTTGYGAYVDLGYNESYNQNLGGWVAGSASTFFSQSPNAASTASGNLGAKFISNAQLLPQTYDTWSSSYEQNGVDEDNNGTFDQGADGLDNDPSASGTTPNGIVDDPPQITVTQPTTTSAPAVTVTSAGERETLAPYPFPLRGVQITIRVYEPDTRQVREMTIVQDFLPD